MTGFKKRIVGKKFTNTHYKHSEIEKRIIDLQ